MDAYQSTANDDFITPTDDELTTKIIIRIRKAWTKLTAADIAKYKQNKRGAFLKILIRKYKFTLEQAENALNTIEYLSRND